MVALLAGRLTGLFRGGEVSVSSGRPSIREPCLEVWINAATALGGAVAATWFCLLTAVAGVLNKAGEVQTDLDRAAIEALKADGTISGGMIPKVDTCVTAVEAGVEGAVILDGRVPHGMLLEIFTRRGAGTLVRA